MPEPSDSGHAEMDDGSWPVKNNVAPCLATSKSSRSSRSRTAICCTSLAPQTSGEEGLYTELLLCKVRYIIVHIRKMHSAIRESGSFPGRFGGSTKGAESPANPLSLSLFRPGPDGLIQNTAWHGVLVAKVTRQLAVGGSRPLLTYSSVLAGTGPKETEKQRARRREIRSASQGQMSHSWPRGLTSYLRVPDR